MLTDKVFLRNLELPCSFLSFQASLHDKLCQSDALQGGPDDRTLEFQNRFFRMRLIRNSQSRNRENLSVSIVNQACSWCVLVVAKADE